MIHHVSSHTVFLWKNCFLPLLPTGLIKDASDEDRRVCFQEIGSALKQWYVVARQLVMDRMKQNATARGVRREDGQPLGTWTEYTARCKSLVEEGRAGFVYDIKYVLDVLLLLLLLQLFSNALVPSARCLMIHM